MGFSSQRIFPYLLDWSMSGATLAKYRQKTFPKCFFGVISSFTNIRLC
jgi:hypothetical protein